MSRRWKLLLTCEHGGHRVPAEYRRLFAGADQVLASHRGWDPGSLELARRLARTLDAPLIASTTTRLLVELNRSPGHPRLFSEFSKRLPPAERQRLLDRCWHPHRRAVETTLAGFIRTGQAVLHVGVHSFTPVLDGQVRSTDLGLLYDPSRESERRFCEAWQRDLRDRCPDLRIHRNVPYRGTSDGLTTFLRRRFPDTCYAGIELEVCQRFPLAGGAPWRTLQRELAASLRTLLAAPPV